MPFWDFFQLVIYSDSLLSESYIYIYLYIYIHISDDPVKGETASNNSESTWRLLSNCLSVPALSQGVEHSVVAGSLTILYIYIYI